MARKRRSSGSGSTWLNTYADMVTLLLTFFVVLLSMSSTDEVKFNAFIKSFSTLPQETIDVVSGNSPVDDEIDTLELISLDELYIDLKDYIEESDQEEYIDISKIDDVVYIRFSSAMFFKPDQHILLQDSIPTLDFVGAGLKEHEEDIRMINVLGFTATIDNGSYWMLSAQRAAAVAIHFNYESGLDASKITVLGYGNQYPVAPNDTEVNRRKNRRVELVIVGNESEEGFDITDALGQYYDNDSYPTQGSGGDVYRPGNADATEGGFPKVENEPIPPSVVENKPAPIPPSVIENEIAPIPPLVFEQKQLPIPLPMFENVLPPSPPGSGNQVP